MGWPPAVVIVVRYGIFQISIRTFPHLVDRLICGATGVAVKELEAFSGRPLI